MARWEQRRTDIQGYSGVASDVKVLDANEMQRENLISKLFEIWDFYDGGYENYF